MKLLLLTNHFDPEEFRCNDVAYELARRGHEVTVLTAIPDYPKGRFHEGYGLFRKRVEKKAGVTIVRVPLIPRGGAGKVRMVLNYASSLLSFMCHALQQAAAYRYDCILVHNTSPAFICLPAVLIKSLRKTPVALWTLDIWPESLVAGGIRSKKVYAVIDCMMRMIYRHCDLHFISSLGFRKLLVERGVENRKIYYFPNWCDAAMSDLGGAAETPELPKGFKIIFAGNLGEAQNLENVLEAARRLKDRTDIQWIFLGDGRKRPWMERYITEHGLGETVYLLGRYPIEAMPKFFEQADALLVSLCDEMCFNLTLPAKVQAYMAAGKPIIGFLNGEGAEIINAARCGVAVNADDCEGLAKGILDLKSTESGTLSEMGENGRKYSQRHFNFNNLMDALLDSIEKVGNPA